jgi:hypothetical protein
MLFQRTFLGQLKRAGGGFEETVVRVGQGLIEDFAFESGGQGSGAEEFRGEKAHEFEVLAFDLGGKVVKMFLLEFGFRLFGRDGGAVLHGAFGLFAVVFGLDVGVEGGVGEILFAASTDEISAFDVFPGSTTGLGGLELFFVFLFVLKSLRFFFGDGELLLGDGSRIHDIM